MSRVSVCLNKLIVKKSTSAEVMQKVFAIRGREIRKSHLQKE